MRGGVAAEDILTCPDLGFPQFALWNAHAAVEHSLSQYHALLQPLHAFN
jgi:hypothetical protein